MIAGWRTHSYTNQKTGKIVVEKHKTKSALKHLFVLPKDYDVTAEIVPEERYYGIYKLTVYKSPIAIKGRFVLPKQAAFGDDLATVYWQDAT